MRHMRESIMLMHSGEGTAPMAALTMAEVGVKGTGKMGLFGVSKSTHPPKFIVSTFFDVGEENMATCMGWNNTVRVQTPHRIYLTSEFHSELAPLSMQDTRVIAPLRVGCGQVVHIAQYRYLVTEAGTLSCTYMTHTHISKIEHDMHMGQIIQLSPTHSCTNDCIAIGLQGLRVTRKDLPTLPTVHPRDISKYGKTEIRGAPWHASTSTDQNGHSIVHDTLYAGMVRAQSKHEEHVEGHEQLHVDLSRDIAEGRDMLEEMRDTAERDRYQMGQGVNVGYVAISVSVIGVLVLLSVCLRVRYFPSKASPAHPVVLALDSSAKAEVGTFKN